MTFDNCDFFHFGQEQRLADFSDEVAEAHSIRFINCMYAHNDELIVTECGVPLPQQLLDLLQPLDEEDVNIDDVDQYEILSGAAAPDPKEAQQFYAPDYYLNSTVQYSDIEGLDHFLDAEGSIGNISVDPLFADPFSNLRLQCNSPCIDAGSNALLPGESGTGITGDAANLNYMNGTSEVLPRDLQLIERKMDDPAISDTGEGTAPIVDMGAYEDRNCRPWHADIWPRSAPCPCGYGDAFVSAGDLAELLANWGACTGCCADIAPVGALDDNVGAADLAELLANWGPPPPDCGGEGLGPEGGDGGDDGTDDSGDYDALDADQAFYEWALSATIEEFMNWLESGTWGG